MTAWTASQRGERRLQRGIERAIDGLARGIELGGLGCGFEAVLHGERLAAGRGDAAPDAAPDAAEQRRAIGRGVRRLHSDGGRVVDVGLELSPELALRATAAAADFADLHAKLAQLIPAGAALEGARLKECIATLYQDIENVSIDYGVMEKSSRVLMVPVEMGWSDVGSWSALPEVIEPDSSGTVCVNAAGHIAVDSSDCLIYADGRIVATVGVHNLVVVSTPDAILVCDRERCQDVKKVVEQLGSAGLTKYL